MINNKVELFLENIKAIEGIKGSWGMHSFQIKSSALNCTMKNEKVDTERINSALSIIKNNTSLFSSFRGINKLTSAITISLEENMEESFKEIMKIYDKLKDEFSGSDFLVIAAQVIFKSRNRVNVDEAVKNTKVAYDLMKKYHRFLTGKEDITNAAIIATTSNNLEETFKDIEECYEYLKENKISTLNNIQALAQTLSLINMPAVEKCNIVLNMKSKLKEKKVQLQDYFIPVLGVLSFLSDNNEVMAENIAKVSAELKENRGFGNFSIGSNFRNMISATLVATDYLENNSEMSENILNSTNNSVLTAAIAMQTAVMISSTAVVVSVNASN